MKDAFALVLPHLPAHYVTSSLDFGPIADHFRILKCSNKSKITKRNKLLQQENTPNERRAQQEKKRKK